MDPVTVNGYGVDTDPATGRPARPCLVTVNAARATFDELELDSRKLRAQDCLVALEAEISPNPYALEPVEPLVDVAVFKRYRLTEPEDLAVLDHRVDLMEMHPREFEKLVVAHAVLTRRRHRRRGRVGRPAPARRVPDPGQADAQPGVAHDGAGADGRPGGEPAGDPRLLRDDVVVQPADAPTCP